MVPPTMASVTVDDFRAALAEFTKRPAPTVNEIDTLASLHLDSLAMLEIIGMLEQKFEVEVNEDDLVDLKSVGDLLRVLNSAH
jgi:acyl carrier protein